MIIQRDCNNIKNPSILISRDVSEQSAFDYAAPQNISLVKASQQLSAPADSTLDSTLEF